MDSSFSLPDVAERVARDMGPFSSQAEQDEAAASLAADPEFSKAESLVYHARVRLTASAKQSAATLRKTYGLGK